MVVQSVPVVYTAVRSPGNMNNTIVVPLLEDGRSHVKGKVEPVLCICGISKTVILCGKCNNVVKLLVYKLTGSFAEETINLHYWEEPLKVLSQVFFKINKYFYKDGGYQCC